MGSGEIVFKLRLSMKKGGSRPRALRPLPALSNSAIVIEEIVSSGKLPSAGLHDTAIGSRSPQKSAPSQSTNDHAPIAPPLFSPEIIPLKYQVPRSLHNRVQNQNGRSQGVPWLQTSDLIQQSLKCRQLVFTPRCFLGALITLGAIFLLVRNVQLPNSLICN